MALEKLFRSVREYLIVQNPDLLFRFLRFLWPNLKLPNGNVFVTRYRDVQEVLSRPEIFTVRDYAPRMDPSVGPFMLARDGSIENQRDKGIMRALISKNDGPKIRSLVSEITQGLLEDAKRASRLELVFQIARRVPVEMIQQYFGFVGPDIQSMFRWSRATQMDMFKNLENDARIHQENVDAGRQMYKHIREILLPRRRQELAANPNLDDVVSRMLRSRFPDEIGFGEERILTNTMGFLVGGVETISQAVVQIVEHLLTHLEQFAGAKRAAEDGADELLYKYCFEALRFNPINPVVVRTCAEDCTVARGTLRWVRVKKDSVVFVGTRSAMMDEFELSRPREFRLDRPEHHYMHFGFGLHTCLGDQVARIEVPEITKHLLLLKNLRALSPPDFQGGPFPEKYLLQFDAS
jgi:cytochrome P450